MEGLEVFAPAFVAQAEAPEVAEARERSFDHVPQHAQPAAVGVIGTRGEQAVDPLRFDQRDHLFGSVGAIADDRLGVAPRPSAWTLHGRTRVEQRGQLLPWSGTLAGVVCTTSGTPSASVSTWRLQPCLPRSVGFGPVCGPL